MLLSSIGPSAVAAQEKIWSGVNSAQIMPPKPPTTRIMFGPGFAYNDDEFHIFWLRVVSLYRVRPLEGETPTEIDDEEASDTNGDYARFPRYRASIRFGETNYPLRIGEISKDNLVADVLTPRYGISANEEDVDNEVSALTEVIGHLKVESKEYEGFKIGIGKLTMEEDEFTVLFYDIRNWNRIMTRANIQPNKIQPSEVQPESAKPNTSGRRWYQIWK